MFKNWFPQDMTTLRKLLWFRTAWEKAGPAPTPTDPLNTFVGSIVRFFSHRALPVVKLEANFTPIQDLHGQEAPWPPGGGKNKVNYSDVSVPASTTRETDLGTITLQAGTYTFSYSLNKTITATRNRPYYKVGSTYTYGSDLKTAGRGSWTFTLAEETSITIGWWYHTVSEACTITNFQLESGSTATAYAPYSNICPISGHDGCEIFVKAEYDAQATPTVTVNFGQTVYGGQLTVFEDGSGQIVAEWESVELSADWYWYRGNTQPPSGNCISTTTLKVSSGTGICSHFKQAGTIYIVDMPDSSFILGANSSFFAYGQSGITAEEFKAFLTAQKNAGTPVTVCYDLATPVTIPLTAEQINTLVGENVVWVNDSDNIQVTAYGSPIT